MSILNRKRQREREREIERERQKGERKLMTKNMDNKEFAILYR